MHFETVLKHLISFFNKEKIDYALVGGMGVVALGYHRTTADIDFLLLPHHFEKLEKYLLAHGYKCIEKNEHAANFVSNNFVLGRVDVLIALTPLSQEMFERVIKKKLSDNIGFIKVVCPEDLIGLKLHGAKNNPKRYLKDMADVQELFQIFGRKMKYPLLKKYFKLFKEEPKLKEFWKDAPH